MEIRYLLTKMQKELATTLPLKSRIYKKEETITTYIPNRSHIFILISGEADLVQYDLNGSFSIIDSFKENDIFGDVFYPSNTDELTVIAKKRCQVLWFDYNLLKSITIQNESLQEFKDVLFQLMFNKISTLNNRAAILTKRSIREKLLAYFEFNGATQYGKVCTLTLSYSDLAKYLSVNRSAMSREINNLIEDGIIKKEGKQITLLY